MSQLYDAERAKESYRDLEALKGEVKNADAATLLSEIMESAINYSQTKDLYFYEKIKITNTELLSRLPESEFDAVLENWSDVLKD